MSEIYQFTRKIKFHPLLIVFMAIGIVTGYFWELFALFFIVFIHELGHASMAQYFQWKIKSITILPFGGYCDVDEHGNRRIIEDFLVIIAGPIQHLFIGIGILFLQTIGLLTMEYGQLIMQYNIMIFLFNLLPIRPLDGGKLVHLFLSKYKPYLESFRLSLISSIVVISFLHLILFIFAPLNLNLWLVLIYLDFSLWTDWKQQKYIFMRFLLERYYGKDSEISRLKTLEANEEDYIYQVLMKFSRGCKHLIDVSGKLKGQGKLDENEILHAYFSEKRVRAQLKDLVYNQD